MNKPVTAPPSRLLTLAAALALTIVASGGYWWTTQRGEQIASSGQPTAMGPVTPAPAPSLPVETAPSAEPPPPPAITLERRESFGRAAGLHKTQDPLRLAASAAIVLDQQTGEVLYQKNDQAVLPIASLTKLMTSILVAEAKLPLDERITVTEEDVDTERNSRSRLRVGTTLTRGEALHLALMSSENRAAHALGRTFPGGLEQFVQAMNRKAQALGMKNTTFVDPTGLSNRNQSTARDVATLVAAASRYPLLREYSTTPQHQVAFNGRALRYLNSNRLVRAGTWEIDLQKTGYIIEAGQCVAMATRVGGQNVIMVLLDSTDKFSRVADAERMKRWVTVQSGGATMAEAPAPKVREARAKPERKATRVAEKAGKADKPAKGEKADKPRSKKTEVAKAKSSDKTSTAKAKAKASSKKTEVAEKKDAGGRVKASFAGRKQSANTRVAERKADAKS